METFEQITEDAYGIYLKECKARRGPGVESCSRNWQQLTAQEREAWTQAVRHVYAKFALASGKSTEAVQKNFQHEMLEHAHLIRGKA